MDTQIEALVRRARHVTAEIKSLNEELKTLTTSIDGLTEVGWSAEIDGVVASKRKGNRKFSVKLALEHFTPEERLECISTGLDQARVRDLAKAKNVIEACMEDLPDAKPVVQLMPS